MPSNLPPARLITTSHAEDGTSIFQSDAPIQAFFPFGPQGSGFSTLSSHASIPVSNTSAPLPVSQTLPRCPPEGVIFTISDFAPRSQSPMHRTNSQDYAAVMSGEIVLKLDGGEEKMIKAGEFVVQGGVNHQWVNTGEEVCRVLFVMVAAENVVLGDGRVLEEDIFHHKK